jgi:hypothetical protein
MTLAKTIAVLSPGIRRIPQLANLLEARIVGRWHRCDAVAGRVRFGDLFATAHYDAQRLNVEAALRLEGKPALQASASLPLDLALVGNRTRQLAEPLTGRVVTQQTDMALLESVFPDVTRARGTLMPVTGAAEVIGSEPTVWFGDTM